MSRQRTRPLRRSEPPGAASSTCKMPRLNALNTLAFFSCCICCISINETTWNRVAGQGKTRRQSYRKDRVSEVLRDTARHGDRSDGGVFHADHAILARARLPVRQRGSMAASRSIAALRGLRRGGGRGGRGESAPKGMAGGVTALGGQSLRPSNCRSGASCLKGESVQGHG